MKREMFAGVLLLFVAATLYWRNLQMEQQVPHQQPTAEPDFVARALKTRTYDADGRLAVEVAANEMRHFEDTQYTEFVEPVYLVYPADSQGVWKLIAKDGALNQNRHMVLSNDVIITAIEPNKPLRTIKTRFLELDLDTMIITTDEPLVAQGVDFEVKATGLWADLNLNQIELKSKVRASYEVH